MGYTFHLLLNPPYVITRMCNYFSLQLTVRLAAMFALVRLGWAGLTLHTRYTYTGISTSLWETLLKVLCKKYMNNMLGLSCPKLRSS